MTVHAQAKMATDEILARLACYGARLDAGELDPSQLEHLGIGSGFIHGTVLQIDSIGAVNTSLLDTSYSSDPRALTVSYSEDHASLVLQANGAEYQVSLVERAPFANEEFALATVGDYLQLHSDRTLFATPIRQCAFIAANRPCTFCTFEPGRVRRLTAAQSADLVTRYLDWKPSIADLAFGGGSTNLSDFGARYYVELASEVRRRHPDLGISIEIVPARREADWTTFLQAGSFDSLVSSLEVWDDQRRSEVCLGKSELSKDLYQERWAAAIEVLGAGSVTSVLLVGLEDLSSTHEGALALVAQGVIPTLIPYRPYDAAPLGHLDPVPHEEYLRISHDVARALTHAGLSPTMKPGCAACGACSLERPLTDGSVAVSLGRVTDR